MWLYRANNDHLTDFNIFVFDDENTGIFAHSTQHQHLWDHPLLLYNVS